MRDDPLLARLAAANPVRASSAPPLARPLPTATPRRSVRRALVVAAAAAVIAVPAVAFAGDIGGLLGLSTHGTTVATGDLPASHDTGLAEAMQSLGWPAQSQLLGTRAGLSIYVSGKPDGGLCLAIGPAGTSGPGNMVSCVPPDELARAPILGLPVTDGTDLPKQGRVACEFAGIAEDGIARVDLVAADGTTLASAPVSDNIYGAPAPTTPVAAVVAYDASGAEVYRTTVGPLPTVTAPQP